MNRQWPTRQNTRRTQGTHTIKAMEALQQLEAKSFDFKEEFNPATGRRHVGLIAEEVEQVCPDLVFHNDENQVEGVKYDDLTVMLLKLCKKQQKQIDTLEQRISALEQV